MIRNFPAHEVPALIIPSAARIINDDAAVWIGPIAVYSTGLAFTVHAAFNTPRDTESLTLASYTRPGAAPALHLTAGYGDGRFATNTVDFRAEPTDPSQPFLISFSSGTGNLAAYADYRLTPAPSGCPLTLSFALPILSITETRVTVTTAQLDGAATRISRLWNDDTPA